MYVGKYKRRKEQMSDFELNSTSGTPGVKFEADTGDCKFTGYSIPQKVNEFYKPILSWFTEYRSSPAETTKFVMSMEYMDNASRRIFEEIFKILEEIHSKGISKVSVVWFFKKEDEDMLNFGQKLEKHIGLKFAYKNL